MQLLREVLRQDEGVIGAALGGPALLHRSISGVILHGVQQVRSPFGFGFFQRGGRIDLGCGRYSCKRLAVSSKQI